MKPHEARNLQDRALDMFSEAQKARAAAQAAEAASHISLRKAEAYHAEAEAYHRAAKRSWRVNRWWLWVAVAVNGGMGAWNILMAILS